MSTFVRSGDTITQIAGVTTVEWRSVGDLSDPSWTHSDPNSLVSSYAYNSATDIHTVGLVAVSPSVADYAINSGTGFTGPRWYKGLTDSAGAPVLAGDRFVLFIRHSGFSVAGGLTQWGMYLGVAGVPASTVLGSLQANGQWMGVTSAGTPNVGAHAVNASTPASLASGTSGRGTAFFSGTPFREKAGVTSIITSATTQNAVMQADGAAWASGVVDSTQVSLWLCATTLGAAVATAGSINVKLEYAVLRMP